METRGVQDLVETIVTAVTLISLTSSPSSSYSESMSSLHLKSKFEVSWRSCGSNIEAVDFGTGDESVKANPN